MAISVSKRGEFHGPHAAGPEGSLSVEIFSATKGFMPITEGQEEGAITTVDPADTGYRRPNAVRPTPAERTPPPHGQDLGGITHDNACLDLKLACDRLAKDRGELVWLVALDRVPRPGRLLC